jgi:AraC-like DNA-binding protein
MRLISIALFITMASCLFMCVWAGFSKQQNNKAKSFFILLMLGFAAVLGEMGVYHIKQYGIHVEARHLYTQIIVFSTAFSVSIPVFFYLYLKSVLRLDSQCNGSDFIHLLIPVVYLLLMLPFSMLELAERHAFLGEIGLGKDIAWPLMLTPTRMTRLASVAIIGAFYLQLCWQELHSQTNLKKRDILKTAKNLKKSYVVMCFGVAMMFVFFMTHLPRDMTWGLSAVIILMALASNWLFFILPELGHDHSSKGKSRHALNVKAPLQALIDTKIVRGIQPSADTQTTINNPVEMGLTSVEKSYRSSVTEQMANHSMLILNELLDNGIYKDSTLSLGKLASEVKVSNHHLSQIINQQYQGTYYDLIHSYRISEAKRLLRETSFSIADITYEVGYNSKSVFYTEFKRQTQLTPTQYKKSIELA